MVNPSSDTHYIMGALNTRMAQSKYFEPGLLLYFFNDTVATAKVTARN